MELRSALRERTLVTNSILVPIFLYPVLIWVMFTGLTFVQGKTEGFTSRVAFVAVPEAQRPAVAEIGRDEKFRVVEVADAAEAESAIRAGRLDAALVFEPMPGDEASALPGNARVRLLHDGSRDRSLEAKSRLDEAPGRPARRDARARGRGAWRDGRPVAGHDHRGAGPLQRAREGTVHPGPDAADLPAADVRGRLLLPGDRRHRRGARARHVGDARLDRRAAGERRLRQVLPASRPSGSPPACSTSAR